MFRAPDVQCQCQCQYPRYLLHLCCKSLMQMCFFLFLKIQCLSNGMMGSFLILSFQMTLKFSALCSKKYKRGCTEMQVLSEVALRFNLNDSEAVHLRTEVAWRDTSIKKVVLLHLAAWVLKWCSYFLCLADDQPKYCDLPISSYSTEPG